MNENLKFSSHNSIWITAVKWLLGLIAIAGFGVTVYLGFIRKTSSNLEYDILSETDFFNKSESASYIKIFIDSLDVQENHLNISTYRIRVSNKGNDNVRYYDYDTGLFGLKIVNGTLLEPPVLLESSTDYIRSKFVSNDSLIKTSFINIPKLAIDVDDYFIVKLVILHEINVSPKFIPVGKISGQKKITVNPIRVPQPNFWRTAFSGGFLVHITRLIAYVIVTIIAVLVTAGLVSFISDKVDEQKNRKIIKELSQKKKIINKVKEDYIKQGESIILELNKVFQLSEAEITTRYKKTKSFLESHRSFDNNIEAYRYHTRQSSQYRWMLEKCYLFIDSDGNITFNKDAKASVHYLYEFLKKRKILSGNIPHVYSNDY